MKYLEVFLMLSTLTSFGQIVKGNKTCHDTKNLPYLFLNLKYDSIVAYDCDETKFPGFIIMDKNKEKNKLNTLIIKNRKKLKRNEIDTLYNSFLCKIKETKGVEPSSCWYSNLSFVYYNKGRPVAHFNIPIEECYIFLIYVIKWKENGHSTTPSFKMKLVEGDRKRLSKLCTQLKFSCYNEK